jgi:hypothetical protein
MTDYRVTLFSAKYGASLEPYPVEDDRKSVRNQLLVVYDDHPTFGRSLFRRFQSCRTSLCCCLDRLIATNTDGNQSSSGDKQLC